MTRARHRLVHAVDRKTWVRAGIGVCSALTAGTIAASCMMLPGGPVSSSPRLSAEVVSASRPTPSLSHAINPASPPAATPAEGHSPQLEKQLSGPLSGTGLAAPTRSLTMSATAKQATAAAAVTSPTLNGIDVASFQHPSGAAINWAQVASAGYTFAAIKATEGNYYVNPYYAGDAAAAAAAGLYVSAYEFANPADSTGAAAADYTAQNAGNYQVGGQYLPLMLDLEYNPYTTVANGDECYGLTPAQMVSWISSFMTEATTLTGAAPIIYTPTNWWNLCTGSSTAFGSDLLWIPAYSVSTPSPLPAGWSNWTFWQYTSSATVPGITGSVDLDYMSASAPVITSASQATFSTGVASSFTVTATGFPAPALTESGALPAGVTFSGGVLSGTPASTAAGSFPIQITATNGAGSVTQSFTLTVLAAVSNVALGQPAVASSVYASSFPATNAVDGNISTIFAGAAGGGWWEVPLARQYTLSEAQIVFRSDGVNAPTERENIQIWLSNSGDMSAGKTVACTLGATPVAYAGTYTCTLPPGPWQYVAVVKTDTNELVLAEVRIFGQVTPAGPAITSASQATFDAGVASSFTVTATGFPAPALTESGALPAGVTFSGGVLSGTPAAGTAGSYPIQITATNGSGSVTQSFTLTVLADSNVALGQPAVASSVYASSFPATNAVDGNISTIFAGAAGGGWWEVPLARQYTLSEAQIVFRSDGVNAPTERENIQIWLSNSGDMSAGKTVACTLGATPVAYAGTYTCTLPPGPWQYVAVVKTDTNELVLAEVRILGH